MSFKGNPEHLKILIKAIEKKDIDIWNKFNYKLIREGKNANLVEINLEEEDLQGINLSRANLSWANLTGVNLKSAFLRGATLYKVNLSRANLERTFLEGIYLREANLYKANLIYTDLSELRTECFLEKADMEEACLEQACLREAYLVRANLRKTRMKDADLSKTNLREVNLEKANIEGANLAGANLQKANMRETILVGAILRKANFEEANLFMANLKEADLKEANMKGVDLEGANLIMTNMQNVDLQEANLTGANLERANLTNANMKNIMLADIEGKSANFYKAILININYTSKETSNPARGFLELATADGLETAQFRNQDFLLQYVQDAFVYAHQKKLVEREEFPDLVTTALNKIKLLRQVYSHQQQLPQVAMQVVKTITAELIKYLKAHPKTLYTLKPRQFEELIAEILASYGWQIQLTPATRDGGYDIFAISKDIAGVTTSWIIECKKYAKNRKVGVDIVRALWGTKLRLQVANALLATTSHFTAGVHKLKASSYDLELKDYEGILEWINEYQPNPDGKLYIRDNKLILPGEK